MSFLAGASMLREANVMLKASWGRASSVWRDQTAARFASEFWTPLQQGLQRYQSAVEELEAELARIERLDDV